MTKRLNLAFRPRALSPPSLPLALSATLVHSCLSLFSTLACLAVARTRLFFLLFLLLPILLAIVMSYYFFPLALVFRPTSFRVCLSSRPSTCGRSLVHQQRRALDSSTLAHRPFLVHSIIISGIKRSSLTVLVTRVPRQCSLRLVFWVCVWVLCMCGRLDVMAKVSRQDVPLHETAYLFF